MKYYFVALGTLVVVCVGCQLDGSQGFLEDNQYYAPPASALRNPGPMVDGPGPGVLPRLAPRPARSFQASSTQLRFVHPRGMTIAWKISDGFAENQLTTPARYDFGQGATYQLKLTGIEGREGLTLYPSLQVYPAHPNTYAYLSHSSVPIELTDEDLDQLKANNYVTKVIYLPDPKFQDLAVAGLDEIVSSRLDPGQDPVAEADRRGTIMVVLRVGNKNNEMMGDGPKPAPVGAARVGVGGVTPVGYQPQTVDGSQGQFMAPVPIAMMALTGGGVPGAQLMGEPRGPGMGAYGPITGQPGASGWGIPMTSTPIGLPGPPHLPLGGPAGLQSHTMINDTRYEQHDPVPHFTMRVRHEPGVRMPRPVSDMEYTETHPAYGPGRLSSPAWWPQGGGGGGHPHPH